MAGTPVGYKRYLHPRSYYLDVLEWLAVTHPSVSTITLVANFRSVESQFTARARRSAQNKSAALLGHARALFEARRL